MTMVQSEAALAAYEKALMLGEGWQAAAEMLAAALRPKVKAPARVDLGRPIKFGRRAKYWSSFNVEWADGSVTRVTGVIFDKPADKMAAAFQAADRLRRARMRHGWERAPGAPTRWTKVMNGIRVESADWWRYVKARDLPPMVRIVEDTGETLVADA